MEVSLEKGLAKVEMKPENKITLIQLQNVVKKNGFAPKSAHVKLNGRFQNNQVVISKSEESVPAVFKENSSLDPQKQYRLEGDLTIEEDSQKLLVVSVQ